MPPAARQAIQKFFMMVPPREVRPSAKMLFPGRGEVNPRFRLGCRMLQTARQFRDLAKQSFIAWMDDGAGSMGAALAFYTLFSMAPLLLLVIAIAGLVIGSDTARDLLMTQLTALVGDSGAAALSS